MLIYEYNYEQYNLKYHIEGQLVQRTRLIIHTMKRQDRDMSLCNVSDTRVDD
jgi:hypothetical protein